MWLGRGCALLGPGAEMLQRQEPAGAQALGKLATPHIPHLLFPPSSLILAGTKLCCWEFTLGSRMALPSEPLPQQYAECNKPHSTYSTCTVLAGHTGDMKTTLKLSMNFCRWARGRAALQNSKQGQGCL